MTDLTHREVIERFSEYWHHDRDNRDDSIDDLRFRAGDQWPSSVRQQREKDGRAIFTINRMGQFIKRVSGSLRQSRPAIDPFPTDDKTDPIIADIYGGLIRQIEYISRASSVYSWAVECAISCGIGHLRVDTKYANGNSFDQDICIKRIVDPLSVTWDSNGSELDRSDAYDCFVSEMVTIDAFKRRFPKEKDRRPADFPYYPGNDTELYWRDDDGVRIASWWCKKPKKKKFGMTKTGQIFDLSKLSREAINTLGITRERDIEDFEIMHQMVSGNDFLSDPEPWAGRFIPIIPCIGEEIPIDNRVVRHGIIRWAKDPQRLYNFWRSAGAESINMATKAPWLITPAMIKGHESYWQRANNANLPYLPWNPDLEHPQFTPQRLKPPPTPTSMHQESLIAQDDMKGATGIYDAALGQKSNETSGVAIEARQEESDTGTFVYLDNFEHMIWHVGMVLVDLIPKVYDGERVVRILGIDEAEAFVPINKMMRDIDGTPVLVNDLTTGQFDVRIKRGPSYANAKQEAKTQLTQLLQASPQLMAAIGELWAEAQDLPSDIKPKLVERMKKLLPPGLSDEPAPVDPAAEAVKAAQMAGMEADVRLKQ